MLWKSSLGAMFHRSKWCCSGDGVIFVRVSQKAVVISLSPYLQCTVPETWSSKGRRGRWSVSEKHHCPHSYFHWERPVTLKWSLRSGGWHHSTYPLAREEPLHVPSCDGTCKENGTLKMVNKGPWLISWWKSPQWRQVIIPGGHAQTTGVLSWQKPGHSRGVAFTCYHSVSAVVFGNTRYGFGEPKVPGLTSLGLELACFVCHGHGDSTTRLLVFYYLFANTDYSFISVMLKS